MGEGGHEKGINCIDFYGGSDRPFLVTGSDDHTVRVWDYHTKSCVRVLEGHSNNVSAVIFHPQLPFLLSAGEDGTLRIWNAQTFRPEASYNFGMERAWGLAVCRAHNAIGLAFDSGSIVFQLGRGDPCASLDPVQGRLVWSRARGSGTGGNEILTGMVRLLDVEGRPIRVPADSEIIPLTPKELGTSDVFPQNLLHSPDGRLVAVWGDEEYVIYSTIGWRNRAFGKGVEIAWAAPGGDVFAARGSNGRVSLNRVTGHDQQGVPLQGVTDCDRIFGGPLLGISSGSSTLTFFDWTGEHLIRTIDVSAVSVAWSPDASHVAIQTEGSCYILAVNREVLRSPQSFVSGEDGIEDAVELVDDLEQAIKSVVWISGNCFVYLTEENRLAYHVVGGDADESFQLALFDKSHFLLGFLPGEQRVYLTDQDLHVTSFAIMPALVNFQSIVLNGGDLAGSMQLVKDIPPGYHARLAVFLQRRGYLQEALEISPDAHFQFDLAVQLQDLPLARELLSTKMAGSSEKWQELGRVALQAWNLPIAEEALTRAGDLASLFLLYAAAGDADGLLQVAREATKKPGNTNLAFAAFVRAGAYVPAFELLLSEGRAAEAALFARTYGLSVASVAKAVEMWRAALIAGKKEKLAGALADPLVNLDKFADARFDAIGMSAQGAVTPRGRSVSFDGNVSVAGSSSTISLKPETEISIPAAVAVPVVVASSPTTVESVDVSGYFSDDQMSMEVNTAGTGTRLEDLEEEIEAEGNGECEAGYEQVEEPDYETSIVEEVGGRESETVMFEPEPETFESERYEVEPTEYETFEPEPEITEPVAFEPEPETIEPVAFEPEPETVEPDAFEPEPETVESEPIIEPSTAEYANDPLLEELSNLKVEEEEKVADDTFAAAEDVLEVVENGADIYDVADSAEAEAEGVSEYTEPAEVYETEYEQYPTEQAYEHSTEQNVAAYEHAYEHSYEQYSTEATESFEYPTEPQQSYTDAVADTFEYPVDADSTVYTTENSGYAAEYDVYTADNTETHTTTTAPGLKAKGSDAEDEIDFGGEDVEGWL